MSYTVICKIIKVDQLDYASLLVITITYKFYPYLNVSCPALLNCLYAQDMGAWGRGVREKG